MLTVVNSLAADTMPITISPQNLEKVPSGTFRYSLNWVPETDSFYREVHKAIDKKAGTVVALKRILMHNEKEGMPVTALREIKILKALKHPCIVNILDMFVVRSRCHSRFSFNSKTQSFQVQRKIPYPSTWSFRTWTTI